MAYIPRDRIDPEATGAEALRPSPGHPEARNFRLPAPGTCAYSFPGRPWIKSREDLIADITRGEDPDVVRCYCEGPVEELIEYLGEVSARSGFRIPRNPPRLARATPEVTSC